MTASLPLQAAVSPAIASSEAHAVTLWTFIQLKARRFTSADALEVIQGLGDLTQFDTKSLAQRLQVALAQRKVTLKHTNALQIAAGLRGSASYHDPSVRKAAPPLLQLVSAFTQLNRPVQDWRDGIQCFCDYAEGDQEGGGMHIYQIAFTPTSVSMGSPLTTAHDEHGRPVPEMQLQWSDTEESQLTAAIASIETFRRRYEETGRAIVDGIAAASICHHNPHADARPFDAINSELVVIEVTPGPSFGDEIARGDEVRCWSEFDKVHPKDQTPAYSLAGPAWHIDKCVYEWQLSTVRMSAGVPTVVTRPLTEAESSKLFRRHRLAVLNRRYFIQEDRVKALPAVVESVEYVELDMEQLAKHTAEPPERGLPQKKRVPLDQLLYLAKVLKLEDPSVLIRKPKRSELMLLDNDELLRTFVSRVHDVVYEAPRRLSDEMTLQVEQAVDLLLGALKMDVVLANGEVHDAFPRQAPYLTYANQGKDMLAKLRELGLHAYAGVFTTVRPFSARNGIERNIKSNSKLRVERVLFLDVDFVH